MKEIEKYVKNKQKIYLEIVLYVVCYYDFRILWHATQPMMEKTTVIRKIKLYPWVGNVSIKKPPIE